MNHISVVFRRNLIEKYCYQENQFYPLIPGFEDYALWVKLLNDGVSFRNFPIVTVYARVGTEMMKRRGGLKYILNEIPSASADIIQQAIKFIVSAAIIERAIEVDNSFSVKEIVQEKLQPDKLEALCTCGLDSRIKSLVLKLIKEHNATSTAA